MSFQFLVGVTLGPHESWPPPWENPGYATGHPLAIPTIPAPDFLIESLQYGHFRIDTAIFS